MSLFKVFFSVIFSTFLAELVTALLTLITWLWISNLSLASFAGVFKMRRALLGRTPLEEFVRFHG